MSAPAKRVFATADQVIAVLGIAEKNLKGKAKWRDPSYRAGVRDLAKEVARWLNG